MGKTQNSAKGAQAQAQGTQEQATQPTAQELLLNIPNRNELLLNDRQVDAIGTGIANRIATRNITQVATVPAQVKTIQLFTYAKTRETILQAEIDKAYNQLDSAKTNMELLELKRKNSIDCMLTADDCTKYNKYVEQVSKLAKTISDKEQAKTCLTALLNERKDTVNACEQLRDMFTENEQHLFNLLYNDAINNSEIVSLFVPLIKACQTYNIIQRKKPIDSKTGARVKDDETKTAYKRVCDELEKVVNYFKITQADNSAIFSVKTPHYNADEKQNIIDALSSFQLLEVADSKTKEVTYCLGAQTDKTTNKLIQKLIIGKFQGVKFSWVDEQEQA